MTRREILLLRAMIPEHVKSHEFVPPRAVVADIINTYESLLARVRLQVTNLKNALPDSYHDDESWSWAWDELSGEAQDTVKSIRDAANALLEELKEEGK